MHLIFRIVHWLTQSFRVSSSIGQVDPIDALDSPAMWPVWFGQRHTADDQGYETRACVVRCNEGYLPHLQISRFDGDYGCDGYGDPADSVPTLAEAIQLAKARESAWLASRFAT